MKKLISTRTHGVIDYVTAGTLFALPRVLGCNRKFTAAVTGVALGKLAYSQMTRHELGLVKLIPMPMHLAMDAVSGAGLAALPLLLDEKDETAVAAVVAMGLSDVAAALMTDPVSSEDRQAAASATARHRADRLFARAPSHSAAVPTA